MRPVSQLLFMSPFVFGHAQDFSDMKAKLTVHLEEVTVPSVERLGVGRCAGFCDPEDETLQGDSVKAECKVVAVEEVVAVAARREMNSVVECRRHDNHAASVEEAVCDDSRG